MSLELLDRPIAFHRIFVDITGSVNAALMLSQAVYWQRRSKEDFWWKTETEWEEETGLSRREQQVARALLKKQVFWLEKRQGIPAKLFFCVNGDSLGVSLKLHLQVQLDAPTGATGCTNQAIYHTETTSETTSEKKDPEPRPAASDSSFEEFWKSYPRKVGKGKAEERWKKLRPSKALIREIQAAVAAQSVPGAQLDLASRTSNSGECFVPHPATWLGQKRWTDPPEILKGQETDAQRKNREYIAKMLAKERG